MYNFYVLTCETIKLYVDEILFYLNYIITCKYNSLSLSYTNSILRQHKKQRLSNLR